MIKNKHINENITNNFEIKDINKDNYINIKDIRNSEIEIEYVNIKIQNI